MPVTDINCPVCKEQMQKKNIPQGIEIDYCNNHGVWLDVGELETFAAAMQSQSAPSGGGGSSKGGIAKNIAKGLGGAVVAGTGFSIGHRLVGGLVNSIFGD